jgi:hypothetical protein
MKDTTNPTEETHNEPLAEITPGVVTPPPALPMGTPASQTSETNAASVASAAVAKRRGRHVANCQCDRCAARRLNPSGLQPGGKAGALSLSPEDLAKRARIGKEAIKAVTHTMDTAAVLYLSAKARKVHAPSAFISKLGDSVPMRPDVRTGVSETGYAVAEKYGVEINLPELALLSFLGQWVFNVAALGADIDALAEANKTKSNEQQPTTKA